MALALPVDARNIKAFVERDWQSARSAKIAYWAEQFRAERRATWDAGQLLLIHARIVRQPFPTEHDREIDIASHVALKARLDRTARRAGPDA